MQAIENVSGVVSRVIFRNENNDFSILKLENEKTCEPVVVTGTFPTVERNQYLSCYGEWVQHNKYGLQFKVSNFSDSKAYENPSVEGIYRFLSSGIFEGIGQGYAKRLIEQFGTAVFERLETGSKEVQKVLGFSDEKMQSILDTWLDHKDKNEVMAFLMSFGFGKNRAEKIYQYYGRSVESLVKKNPYQLEIDIDGIGFKICDEIAEKVGIPKNAKVRIQAGIRHILREGLKNGHCALFLDDLMKQGCDLLEVLPEELQQGIQDEEKDRRIIISSINGNTAIYLKYIYYYEKNIEKHLKRLLNSPKNIRVSFSDEGCGEVKLTEEQDEAIKTTLEAPVTIITGGPGVGKTTIQKFVVKNFLRVGAKVLLCSPTGKAAKKLSESTREEASTIHRLLGYDFINKCFIHNEEKPLNADLIVVDEASMIDVSMMSHLLEAIPDNCRLVLVGDVDQLPSVGPGMILYDCIHSERISVIRLTKIIRQAENSSIIRVSHEVNNGIISPTIYHKPESDSDFIFLEREKPEHIKSEILNLVSEVIPNQIGVKDVINTTQILTPMNKGDTGVHALNLELKKVMNKRLEYLSCEEVERFGTLFSEGDKVIQTVNNYKDFVMNGEIGFIENIDKKRQEMTIEFGSVSYDDVRTVIYKFDELKQISLAYATTIHKAQGSESSIIIMPISTQHYIMLQRNLLYTGITRGKKLVFVVGQKEAFELCVKNFKAMDRVTNLKNLLR